MIKKRHEVLEFWHGDAEHPVGGYTEDLVFLREEGRKEYDHKDLRYLARLEVERPDLQPEPGTVDLFPEYHGQRQKGERDQGERVLVLGENLVVAQKEDDEDKTCSRDGDPDQLVPRKPRAQAIYHDDADGCEARADGEKDRVRARREEAKRQVQHQEDGGYTARIDE